MRITENSENRRGTSGQPEPELERCGLLIADPVPPYLDFEAGSSLDLLQAASVNYRIAIGPHAGRKALTLYSVPPMEEAPEIPLLARRAGFS